MGAMRTNSSILMRKKNQPNKHKPPSRDEIYGDLLWQFVKKYVEI